jgi:hypothetical protein
MSDVQLNIALLVTFFLAEFLRRTYRFRIPILLARSLLPSVCIPRPFLRINSQRIHVVEDL